ncbi:ABC transporter substrate-binding protein [Oceanispirochaeta sp.]|jgi:iron complex transport system substrate-binding protein|uniref:ABC transporter substrate-binding protein n=1 Tax=Oceanispirochaeta sp. TaxID=2035350 RepID=UPI00260426C3|nr:ABC transporter substrate-binding protein [Oceanispirochaeta sp.]MDA3958271.1 ABC transporter substrate-binding protein [Oceanispirochaeta sp.]
MKTIKFIFTLILICQSFLWGSGSQDTSDSIYKEKTESPIIIHDSLGRRVVLPEIPQRIVQTGSSAFLMNDAIYLFPEAGERVVAMSDSNQKRGYFLPVLDPEYDKKIILPRTINIEEIMAASPDLVLMKDFLFSKYDKEFQKVGIPVIYLNLESPEAWNADLEILGQIFGNQERAEELQKLFSDYTMKVLRPLERLKPEEKKRNLILYYSEKDGTGAFQVPPLSYIQTRMVEMSGSEPVWVKADLGKTWTKVGFEQIAAWDPDQIFLISYRSPVSEVLEIIEDSPYWQELRAYKEGEIHPFPMDFHSWDQPDPRWLIGLQWMASISHPEFFPDLDMNKTAEKFFADFYNISAEDYRSKINPVLEGIE